VEVVFGSGRAEVEMQLPVVVSDVERDQVLIVLPLGEDLGLAQRRRQLDLRGTLVAEVEDRLKDGVGQSQGFVRHRSTLPCRALARAPIAMDLLCDE